MEQWEINFPPFYVLQFSILIEICGNFFILVFLWWTVYEFYTLCSLDLDCSIREYIDKTTGKRMKWIVDFLSTQLIFSWMSSFTLYLYVYEVWWHTDTNESFWWKYRLLKESNTLLWDPHCCLEAIG